MDPHLHNPASNPSNREVKSGGIPWNGVEEEEDEGDWSIDQSSADDDYAAKEPQPYSRLQFGNLDARNPKNQHLYAEDLDDDEEDELGKGDEEEDDEDDDGIDGEEDEDPDWDDNNRQANGTQEQLEQPQQQKQRQQHNGSSQTDTSGEGDDGRNYYIQNEDEMYVDRLNAREGVGGEEEFESPTEENHDHSGDQTEQEVIKAEEEDDEEQGEESGYNDLVSERLQEQGILQDEDKDASERMVSTTPKTPGRAAQKRKSLSSMGAFGGESATRKPKKKNTNVWTKTSSRKGGKKNRSNGAVAPEETAFITPVPRLPDKVDDSPDMMICLSKIYKAEKVELSEDRLTAGSVKGYRMVRATRGVTEGAWYFEIKIVHLGATGHTRLGWSTEKGDVQAPVGYDANSYSYRDVDGSKVHKAVREPYGEVPYCEGDIIGFYINLPDGAKYAPRPPQYVLYKGQIHCRDSIEEPTKIVPGSEISFFKNGICQGVAFKNINAGRYYPAASMYTLPHQPNCTVRFNFGPQFDCFPEDFGDWPLPKAMYEAPYCGIDERVVEQGESLHENGQSSEKKA